MQELDLPNRGPLRAVSVKLDETTRDRLKRLAKTKRHSQHYLMKQAILDYIEREETWCWNYDIKHDYKFNADHKKAMSAAFPVTKGLPAHIANQIAEGNNRLRTLRGWRGMTRAQLVKALAAIGSTVTEATIAAIEDETMRPVPALWAALAHALNVEWKDLVG
jgi:predicted DNA-binding protein/DNA-binding XRE family transcriptional regulator